MGRMCSPETSVINNLRCVTSQKSEGLINTGVGGGGERERVWHWFESRLLEGTVRLHVEDLNVTWEGDGCVAVVLLV
jgi:hypothetical protein